MERYIVKIYPIDIVLWGDEVNSLTEIENINNTKKGESAIKVDIIFFNVNQEYTKKIGKVFLEDSIKRNKINYLFKNWLKVKSKRVNLQRNTIIRYKFENINLFFDYSCLLGFLFYKQKLLERILVQKILPFLYGALLTTLNGTILHGTSIIYDKRGILFLGESGVGKTTIGMLLENSNRIADDIAPIVISNGNIWLLSSPWRHWNTTINSLTESSYFSRKVKTNKIFLLRKSSKTFIREVKYLYAIQEILTRYIHFFYNYNPQIKLKIFYIIENILTKIPVYEFGFFFDKKLENNKVNETLERVI